MRRFVVFLRAVNVGRHTVTKEKLREAFTDTGFLNVSTSKQSGNVILETDASPEEVKKRVETKLHQALGYNVRAFVRTIPQLKQFSSSRLL